jgi:hypothetical protein
MTEFDGIRHSRHCVFRLHAHLWAWRALVAQLFRWFVRWRSVIDHQTVHSDTADAILSRFAAGPLDPGLKPRGLRGPYGHRNPKRFGYYVLNLDEAAPPLRPEKIPLTVL